MQYREVKKDIQEIWSDVWKNPWKTGLVLIVILFMMIGITTVTTVVSHWAATWVDSPKQPQKINAELELYYQKKDETQDKETTLYSTIFELSVHVPPFYIPKNPRGGFNFQWHGPPDIQCDDQWTGTATESAGSYSSSTQTYLMTCKTYRPIIDNGNLFSIKEF